MKIRSETVGILVPAGDWQGYVHSVFEHAVNLQVKGETLLITVLASDDVDLPQGIRIPRRDSGGLHLSRGEMVTCADGILHLATAAEIDLQTGRPYSSPIRSLSCQASFASRRAARERVGDALDARQVKENAGILIRNLAHDQQGALLETRIAAGLQQLSDATRKHDLDDASRACKALIGLGVGLTPSGDDILVGFLAGLCATCSNDPRRMEWGASLCEEIARQSHGTNDISATYLLVATLGQFSSPLSDLTLAICSGASGADLADAAERLFQIGHSSGMDMARGLLAALGTLD